MEGPLAEETPAAPSLYDTSAQLMGRTLPVLQQSMDIGERRAGRMETSAAAIEKEAGAIEAKAREQEAERTKAQPVAPDLKTPPSTAARPFLQPGDSILGQLGTIMQGIGLVAMGITGTKGRGYAYAATAALKGAAEGWQAGDSERVKREMVAWQENHKNLMDQYQLERDAFNDLLTNQKLTMSERFAQVRMRADVMGLKDLADQARQENLAGVLNYLQEIDKSARENKKLDATIAHWNATQATAERNFQALQGHRKVTEELGERRQKLAEDNAASVLKLEREDDSLSNSLRSMSALESSIARLHAKGIIPKGATAVDKIKATFALQTSVGDEQVAQDIETVKRIGTALLVGSELAAGLSPSVARLKVVGEAEAAGATAIPKSFWDAWFVRQREAFSERRKTIRGHLRTRANTPGASDEAEEPEILFTAP